MTTRPPASEHELQRDQSCGAFEDRLSGWLEGELDDAERLTMERHHAECAACAALMADLDRIVGEAAALPLLSPSRDLWSGVEGTLGAPVISLNARRSELGANIAGDSAGTAAAGSSWGLQRTVSVRWFAVAATMLVAVSSGVTWTIARAGLNDAAPSASVATTDAPRARDAASGSSTVSAPTSVPASAVTSAVASATSDADSAVGTSNRAGPVVGQTGGVALRAASMTDVDGIYEREIAALRRIVNERFAELDSATVAELRSNLEVIDRAIEDSRRALSRDPRSRVLSSELDRTLEAKLSLMRRVALL
ncbi:MAG TPA: zf-HC2 domain-containing protein [Gemmatimonas sp.]|nr:zf-HC2 domain-containing protein [Gemmatimonas sp.]